MRQAIDKGAERPTLQILLSLQNSYPNLIWNKFDEYMCKVAATFDNFSGKIDYILIKINQFGCDGGFTHLRTSNKNYECFTHNFYWKVLKKSVNVHHAYLEAILFGSSLEDFEICTIYIYWVQMHNQFAELALIL